MFWNKEKEEWLVLSSKDDYFKVVSRSNLSHEDKFCGIVFKSKDYEQAENICRILIAMQLKFNDKLENTRLILSKDISKLDLSNKLSVKDGNLTIDGTCYIRSNIVQEDPNTFYAVQGQFPHITVSKYYKECEDTFNYCLRQEEGNLSLLPKNICFKTKSDAIEYQNKLIQNELYKTKSKK